MNTIQEPVTYTVLLRPRPRPALKLAEPANDRSAVTSPAAPASRNRIIGFFAELRRRRVCRAAASYAVAMWLVCQVLEIVAPALDLPDWTLKFAILIGLLGLPIALILSWLFEITPQGLVVDGEDSGREAGSTIAPARRLDRIIDCTLVLTALVIGAQLAIGSVGTATASDADGLKKIVVTPFRIADDSDGTAWSEGLVFELQHEIIAQTDLVVISPGDPYGVKNSYRLDGAVTLSDGHVNVTAAIVDNDTGIVSWSQRFTRPRSESMLAPAEFAKEIVAALPSP